MKCTLKSSNNKTTITLSGEFVIDSIADIHSKFVEAIKNTENVTVDVKNVTEADLSALQLLCSAHKTAHDKGKNFSVGKMPEAMLKITEGSGYFQKKGCLSEAQCLWSSDKTGEDK